LGEFLIRNQVGEQDFADIVYSLTGYRGGTTLAPHLGLRTGFHCWPAFG
jgi:hypothetical protein